MAKRVFPVNLPWAPTPKFTLIKKLGKGSYGTVYKAEEDGQEFAVKILSMTKKYGIESPTELDIMTRLSHPNLIHCCGIYPIQNINPRSKTNQLALKMPLAHSDLCGYLKKNKQCFMASLVRRASGLSNIRFKSVGCLTHKTWSKLVKPI